MVIKSVLLVMFVVAAISSSAPAQEFAFPVLPKHAPAGTGERQACTVAALIGEAQCGVFRVWEDRERQRGRTIDIAFVVLEALEFSAPRKDALILLPGGPGEAFVESAVPVSRQFPELRRTRDLLLVDVRGVGRSQALVCDVPYPGGLRSRFLTIFPTDHVGACRDALSRRATLSLYTTAQSVDDLEQLRSWLGYTQFNLIGASYGTRVAQVYMRRHPKSVRTAVLNGVAPVAEPGYVQHARMLQDALERVIGDCSNDDTCRSAHPNLGQQFAELLDRFRRDTVTVEVQGERMPFPLGALAYALRGLLYNRAAQVPAAIIAAADGDVRPLAEYYVQRTAWVSSPTENAGYHFSVLCAEDIAPLTDEDVRRATAGTFMGAHLIDSYRAACRLWPHARLQKSHFTPVRSEIPTLLLSGARDPVTPPSAAEAVARHLSHALHVVVPMGGHGVGGPCVRRLMVQLIDSGSVEGLRSACD